MMTNDDYINNVRVNTVHYYNHVMHEQIAVIFV